MNFVNLAIFSGLSTIALHFKGDIEFLWISIISRTVHGLPKITILDLI